METDEPNREPTDWLASVPERWIQAQQVALGTALLTQLDRPPSARQQKIAFSSLWSTFERPDSSEEARYRSQLETLPPAVLESLNDLSEEACGFWHPHQTYWYEALDLQRWDGKRSPIAGAKLIANRILTGALTPPQLARVASRELGRDWSGIAGFDLAMTKLITSATDPGTSLEARLWSLECFRASVHPPRWDMVVNAILQQSFSWPLLLMQSGEVVSDCTLPLLISVQFGSNGGAWLRSDGEINCQEWEYSVRRARNAAAKLWSLKHASWAFDFQRAIANASVIIDVTLAEKIAAPYKQWLPEGLKFHFDGQSLEVYLALVILGHFIDRTAMETTCATGILGKAIPNGTLDHFHKEGEDRQVYFPENVHPKVHWKANCAERLAFVDLFISPTPSHRWKKKQSRRSGISAGQQRHPSAIEGLPDRGHMKIREGQTLGDFADEAFGQLWRRHRYVRCPDLAHAFRTGHDQSPDQEEINTISDALQANRYPVIEFHPSIKATSVVRALKRVSDKAAEVRTGGNKRVGSYSFVRATANEANERFWQTIFHVLKAPDTDFSKFRYTVSQSVPAKMLADQLNWLNPDQERSQRAPDVLVIVGSKYLSSRVGGIPSGPFSRLQLSSLVPAIQEHIVPSPIRAINKLIGHTRIILVPEDWCIESDSDIISSLEDDLQESVERLSIFRHGFTYQMARSMLRIPNDRFNAIMARLVHASYRGHNVLEYAEAAGEYFLPVRAAPDFDQSTMSKLHLDAANAIVGFLEKGDSARFDFRDGLSPARLHEAEWHLGEAWKFRQARYHESGLLRERLSGVGEIFGWSRVRWAVERSRQDGPDILEAVEQHLRHRSQWIAHPIELVLAAKLAFKLECEKKIPVARGAQLRKLWFDTALEACDAHFDRIGEGAACRYVVATSRACMTMAESRDLAGFNRAFTDIEEGWRLQDSASEILSQEWFEFIGDAEDDPYYASEHYRQGFWNDEILGVEGLRVESLTKYLGSLHLARITPSAEFIEQMQTKIPSRAVEFVQRTNRPKNGLCTLNYVEQRWSIGRNILLTTLGRANGPGDPITRGPKRPPQSHANGVAT